MKSSDEKFKKFFDKPDIINTSQTFPTNKPLNQFITDRDRKKKQLKTNLYRMKGLFGDEISQDFFTKKYLMCVKETVKRRRKFFTKKSTSEIKQNLYWDMTAI